MLTDHIAQLIEEMLNESNGILELQRNEMANRIGCVPSQISYVISSRFTPERGYMIESRRGGGGCIRIVRKEMGKNEYLMHFFFALGDEVDEATAVAFLKNLTENGYITDRELRISAAVISDAALSSLPPAQRKTVRASVLKQLVLSLMSCR